MRHRNYLTLAAVVLAAAGVLAFGAATTQGADGPGPAGTVVGGRHPGVRATGVPAGAGPGTGMMMHPEVEVNVSEDPDGVTILVTSRTTEVAEAIKTRMPQRIEQMRELGQAGEQAPEADAARPVARRRSGLAALLSSDKVDVQVSPRDDGVAIVVSTDDPDLAARLKTAVPTQVEAMRQMRQTMRNRLQQAPAGPQGQDQPFARPQPQHLMRNQQQRPGLQAGRDWLQLALQGEVEVNLAELDDGVTITLTSDNPEVAARLKAQAAARLQQLERARQRIQEGKGQQGMPRPMRAPGAGANVRPVPGQTAPGLRPQRVAQPPQAAGRQIDPEMRRMIREEIRRYLEETRQEAAPPVE